jgi:hypothetical protein
MAVSRALVVCVLLAAIREASALAVGRPGDAEPDTAEAPEAVEADAGEDEGEQLLGSRSDDDIGDDGEGITVDIRGCAAEERASMARGLQQTYRDQFESRVEAVFGSVEGPAYLTVGEARSHALLRNFLAHVQQVTAGDGVHSTVVAVELDDDGYERCTEAALHYSHARLDIRCVSLAGWLPGEFFGSGVNAGPWTCVYNMIIWTKPEIFLTAVNASDHNIMLIDTDVVIYHDMFKLGEEAFKNNTDAKLAVAHEIRGYRNPNTGVVLGTKEGLGMLEWWTYENINCVNQFAGDQAAFANLAKFGDNLHFWKQLAVIRVPEVGQCGNRGNWATHYNCLGGRKQRVMQNSSDWHDDQWASRAARLLPDEQRARAARRADLIGQPSVVEAMKASGDWWVAE